MMKSINLIHGSAPATLSLSDPCSLAVAYSTRLAPASGSRMKSDARRGSKTQPARAYSDLPDGIEVSGANDSRGGERCKISGLILCLRCGDLPSDPD
jgi:hypothetical protein